MLTLSSCSQDGKRYTIGVSQCSEDIWREKQNAELRMGAYFHDNVELKFAAAYDSDERQVQQIDSLMNEGIDLLIVAPNQVNTISPAIDRAYDKGIPVIVFERKTGSQKYTAFISADNYEMGHVMGEYIVSRLHGKGNVLEIKGLAGSSPAIERHNGFMDAIKDEPGIKVVGSLQGDWTEETACQISKQWLAANEGVPVDLVFGANDRTAMGAREALGEKPLYCGIDGLPGKNGGIQLVRDSLLDASFIYPTHGDQLMDLAIRIMEGQPYEKETMLMSALVTHDNAKVLLMQSEEMMKQASQLDQLHAMADGYLEELGAQRVVNWLALGFIFLLVGLFVLFYLYHLRKIALQRERVMHTLWNMQPDSISVGHEQNEESAAAALPTDTEEQEEDEPANVSLFITRFKEVVEARLEDSDVGVEELAAAVNVSKSTLSRKLKSVSGKSPLDFIRIQKMRQAQLWLQDKDRNVTEIAISLGYSDRKYFTSCFKKEFGMTPTDYRKEVLGTKIEGE